MGRNWNKERTRRRDDHQAWRRLMVEDRRPQRPPQTPLKPATRRCARCGAEFVSLHDPASLAACFCPNCAHMVPDGWED
jgi:hypothetical protein